MRVPVRFPVLISFQIRYLESHVPVTYSEGGARLRVDAILRLEVLANEERPCLVDPLI